MEIIFDDNKLHLRLAPLTLTRPVADIRFGIHTNAESWLKVLESKLDIDKVSYKTEDYLYAKFDRYQDER